MRWKTNNQRSEFMFISIIIPAYNEEEAIQTVLDDIKKVMDGTKYKYELIVVDDCSTDNTAKLARQSQVEVISTLVQSGSGGARKVGIHTAKGEIIVMLDADGTYTIEDIPKLLNFFPEYDQVIAARTSEQGTLRLLRKPAKWFIKSLAGYLVNTKIPDLNSGLRAFKKDLMLKYTWLIPDGFSCVSTMTMSFLSNKHKVKWIPSEYKKRIGKSKFHPLKDTYSYLLTVIRLVMLFNPIKLFFPIGGILLLVGFLKSLQDILIKIMSPTLYLDVVFIITGINILILGLIADLINLISKKKSP